MLEHEPFAARERKDGSLEITFQGRLIMTVPAGKAGKLVSRLAIATGEQYQLILAKATGNFKRGNERSGSERHS